MHHICLIEDEQSLSNLIKMNLELEGYRVTTFNHGKKALENMKEIISAHLVILDVMLPEVSGLEICSAIRKLSAVPILILSAKGTTEDRIAGLRIGANDYLPKPFDLEELILRVHNLLPPEISDEAELKYLKIGDKLVDFASYSVYDKGEQLLTSLSKKEIELLKFFHSNEGIVVSREEILDKVWGTDQFPTSRTIDNFILSFRKLFERDPKNPEYFHSIRGVGYKFTNPN